MVYLQTMRGNASVCRWWAKLGGVGLFLISQMKAMEEENRRLKRMDADMGMQADSLQEALAKM